ncbi:MAG TPA: hypothetical protein PJ986_09655 [Gammaproteobacteria bacterium]|nr:hypothetical protein [Gammaproteobacteria bacterium]
MCHQTVSLVARHLEAHGISTVCVGSAYDILAAARPPRACYVDYPLGHTTGKPFDRADQASILRAALALLEKATGPDTLLTLPNRWGDDAWREEAASTEAKDTRQPRDETPQFQLPADRAAAIASGAFTP